MTVDYLCMVHIVLNLLSIYILSTIYSYISTCLAAAGIDRYVHGTWVKPTTDLMGEKADMERYHTFAELGHLHIYLCSLFGSVGFELLRQK